MVQQRQARQFERYVAIGDSSTEGLDDPDGRGGFRGWADRLAAHVAAAQEGLLYANLAVRGRTTRRILNEQLQPALAMHPDLVTLFSGTNDVVRPRFDPEAVGCDITAMHCSLIGGGATLLTFTLPDLAPVMPLARPVSARVRALNDTIRSVCRATGALLVDLALHPVASDPRLWSADRLHANAEGHRRIAAALAEALGLPGTDRSWSDPLPAEGRRSLRALLSAELRWGRDWFLPWVWRHARGRSSGDGRRAKRPALLPIQLNGQAPVAP